MKKLRGQASIAFLGFIGGCFVAGGMGVIWVYSVVNAAITPITANINNVSDRTNQNTTDIAVMKNEVGRTAKYVELMAQRQGITISK